MLLAAISLILSIAAILISILSFRYTKRQTEIMEQQESRRTREAESLKLLWEQQKFNQVVSGSLKIGPPLNSSGPSKLPTPTTQLNLASSPMDAERKKRELDVRAAVRDGSADDLLVRIWNEIKAQAKREKSISAFFPDEQSSFSGDQYKLRVQQAHGPKRVAKEIQLHKSVMGIDVTGSIKESFELNRGDDEHPLSHNEKPVTIPEVAEAVLERLKSLL
ncbi:MAG TPA: hypothetical protein VFN26_05850 [Candidatus Acidoferrum sp.]|nr:hypothetical protein [Candidatus Acidoferrum sp.]